MTCGIYCIEHIDSGKKYIGKSKHIENRIAQHMRSIRKEICPKDTNRHLFNAVKVYGVDRFNSYIIEEVILDDSLVSERELFWIDHFKTCDRAFGYNLRRDSSTKMIVHDETKALLSKSNSGENNPNYGKRWNQEMRQYVGKMVKIRHASGAYKTEQALKNAEIARLRYIENRTQEHIDVMAQRVKESKQKWNKFLQYTSEGDFIREWDTIDNIIEENPTWKKPGIYSVCNGYKPRYMGFRWRKVKKDFDDYGKLEFIDTCETDEHIIRMVLRINKGGNRKPFDVGWKICLDKGVSEDLKDYAIKYYNNQQNNP